MLAPDRSFPNGSPVCDYWLSRCEGFTVRAGHRTLGVVATVDHEGYAGRADTLVIQKRHHRRRTLPTDEVLAVVPARKELLARRNRHEPSAARRALVAAKPAGLTAAAALSALARWIAAELRVHVPRLARRALAEIHDRNVHHGDEPSIGRAHRRPNEYDYGLNTRAR
jgi:hypothetical protein